MSRVVTTVTINLCLHLRLLVDHSNLCPCCLITSIKDKSMSNLRPSFFENQVTEDVADRRILGAWSVPMLFRINKKKHDNKGQHLFIIVTTPTLLFAFTLRLFSQLALIFVWRMGFELDEKIPLQSDALRLIGLQTAGEDKYFFTFFPSFWETQGEAHCNNRIVVGELLFRSKITNRWQRLQPKNRKNMAMTIPPVEKNDGYNLI